MLNLNDIRMISNVTWPTISTKFSSTHLNRHGVILDIVIGIL